MEFGICYTECGSWIANMGYWMCLCWHQHLWNVAEGSQSCNRLVHIQWMWRTIQQMVTRTITHQTHLTSQCRVGMLQLLCLARKSSKLHSRWDIFTTVHKIFIAFRYDRNVLYSILIELGISRKIKLLKMYFMCDVH